MEVINVHNFLILSKIELNISIVQWAFDKNLVLLNTSYLCLHIGIIKHYKKYDRYSYMVLHSQVSFIYPVFNNPVIS